MTRLVRLANGIGRVVDGGASGDRVEVISTSHADLAEMFADASFDPDTAPVISSHELSGVKPLRPVLAPSQLLIAGLSYRAHAAEIGADTPASPRFVVSAGGPDIVTEWNHPIVLPDDAPTMVDYEAELGLIIGTRADGIGVDDAWAHVGGLVVVNDVSARDVQNAAMAEATDAGLPPSVGRSKSYPAFKPVSAIVYTPDEFDVEALDLVLTTVVNGDERQRGSLDDLIFTVPEIVAAMSERVVLEPGDLICTGTPGGVGLATETFLQAGDVVEVAIDGLGTVTSKVAAAHG